MQIDTNCAAIVTGGGSGLGEATAEALAERGARITIFDRDETKGTTVAQRLGGLFCAVDVASESSVEAAFDRARQVHGQERLLINCAGIGPSAKTVSRKGEDRRPRPHDLSMFEQVIGVNLIGTFRCIAISAAGMTALEPVGDSGERGVIINTASIAAQDGQIGQAAYSASKAGIVGMTLPIARDLMSEGVRINTILPGMMRTPMIDTLSEPVQRALEESIPFPKRLGRPQEFAAAALMMIENSYLNAACLRLDAAIRLAPR